MSHKALDYLFEELWYAHKDKFHWQSILMQAKEIDNNKHIDTIEMKNHIRDVRRMIDIIERIDNEILLNPYYEISPRLREEAKMVKVKLKQYFPASFPTEISDEEIEKQSNKVSEVESYLVQSFAEHYFELGAKWYREQIKQIQ